MTIDGTRMHGFCFPPAVDYMKCAFSLWFMNTVLPWSSPKPVKVYRVVTGYWKKESEE